MLHHVCYRFIFLCDMYTAITSVYVFHTLTLFTSLFYIIQTSTNIASVKNGATPWNCRGFTEPLKWRENSIRKMLWWPQQCFPQKWVSPPCVLRFVTARIMQKCMLRLYNGAVCLQGIAQTFVPDLCSDCKVLLLAVLFSEIVLH